MCQGCQHTLRLVDGTVPPPPNDLSIARAEICPYRDSSGNLIKESACSALSLPHGALKQLSLHLFLQH